MDATHEIKFLYREPFRQKIGKNSIVQIAETSILGEIGNIEVIHFFDLSKSIFTISSWQKTFG